MKKKPSLSKGGSKMWTTEEKIKLQQLKNKSK